MSSWHGLSGPPVAAAACRFVAILTQHPDHVPEPIANGQKPDWSDNRPLQDTSRIDVQLADARRYALPTI